MVKTWLADELLPFAFESYTKMGIQVNETLVMQTKTA
jgi:hypothetical protein